LVEKRFINFHQGIDMRNVMLGLALLTTFNQAHAFTMNVTDFNFNYQNPHGEGKATSFSRSSKINQGEAQVTVDRLDRDFRFSVTGAETQEFELKNAPSLMTDAETMSVGGFNLNISEQIDLSLDSARFTSKDDVLKLDGVALNCLRQAESKEIMDQLILGCIQKINFKVSKYSSQQVLNSFQTILEEAVGENPFEKNNLSVSSVALKANAGKYELSADVKAQVSGKVTSKGNFSYDPTNGIIAIKISEVKVAFLNITSKVFDELKKNESEKLRVKQPFVYISIK
jgi:hypothetical protein